MSGAGLVERICTAFVKPLRGAHRRRGRVGERLAGRYLKKQGYRILARNLRNRSGELDLVALSPDGVLVAVEVKSGAANPAYPPEWRVDGLKQRKIVALTAQLARRHRLTDRRWRFDVVAVDFSAAGPPAVRHHVGAFESPV